MGQYCGYGTRGGYGTIGLIRDMEHDIWDRGVDMKQGRYGVDMKRVRYGHVADMKHGVTE